MFRRLALYPFLFSIYLVLSLLVPSLTEVSPGIVWRPLAWLLAITAGVMLVFRWRAGDWRRAGFLAFLLLAFLFVYGHLYRFVGNLISGPSPVFLRLVVLVLWSAGIAALASRIFWRRWQPEKITAFLNLLMSIVLLFPLLMLAFALRLFIDDPLLHWQRPAGLSPQAVAFSAGARPDIYYIIVDGYSRADILSKRYDYDNRPFLDFLESRGFYIAEDSSSNYLQTALSLASSLNMNYLDEMSTQGAESLYRLPLKELIVDSRVRHILEANGYQTVAVTSGYSFSEMPDAGLYLSDFVPLNELEQLLLSATPLIIAADWVDLHLPLQTYAVQRKRINDALDALSDIPSHPGPKFVFVHIVAPHPPFVFGPDGEPVEPRYPFTIDDASKFPGTASDYHQGYVAQLQFLNRSLERVIADILEKSPQEPIILLQGDHGPRLGVDWQAPKPEGVHDALAILNAYYLPAGGAVDLYPQISPVNSFRVIFNRYFGTDFPRLGDAGYFSNFGRPYQFRTVEALRSAQDGAP